MKLVSGSMVVLSLVLAPSLLSTAGAQDMDTMENDYLRLTAIKRNATAEHLSLKMLDAAPTTTWKVACLNRLGVTCMRQERMDDAEKYFLAAYKETLPPTHGNRGWIPNNLSELCLEVGRLDEAERWNTLARTNMEAVKGPTSREVALVLFNLGRIQYQRKQLPAAEQSYRAALTVQQKVLGNENDAVSYSLSNLGRVLAEQGKFDEAETMLTKAVAMQEKLLGKEDRDAIWTTSHLAYIHRQRGAFAKAEEIDRLVLAAMEKAPGIGDKRLAESCENLAADLEKLDKADEAKTLLARAADVQAKRAVRLKGRATKEVEFQVEVVSPQAEIKAGTTVLLKAKKGERFQADHVDGQWYAVVVMVGDERKTGYLNYRDIAIANESAVMQEIRWQELSPPAGNFSASMPGSAKPTKQIVNGVENFAYEVDVADILYMVTFFDIPGGSVLTFDAAIGAYTTSRKAQLLSQKAIEKDLYPGREFAAKLPNGTVSRMQLI